MANRIIQTVYDLKDKVSGKLIKISQSLKAHGAESDRTSDKVVRDNKRASESYTRIGTTVGKLRGALSGFGRGMLKVTGIATGLAGALVGLVTVRLFGGGIKSAVEFGDALRQVGALADATPEQMERLKQAANDMGEAYGVSAIESVQALDALVRATGDADAAIAQLPATLALAKAGGIEFGAAADTVVQTLSQFQLGFGEAERVADVLAATANNTTASVESVAQAMSFAAPVAAQLGISLEDTAAAVGELAQQGFSGSRAGTALRQVFVQLLTPSSKFRAELQELGIQSTDFNVVMQELAKRGDGATQAILALGDQASPAILSLVNSGSVGLAELQASLRNVQGEAARTAQEFTDSFGGAQGRLASAFDVLRRTLVEGALKPIGAGFDALATKIREFVKTDNFARIAQSVEDFSAKAVKAVGEFLGSLDFEQATRNIGEFVETSGQKLSSLAADLATTASAVRKTIAGISAAWNAFAGVVEMAGAGLAKIAQGASYVAEKVGAVTDKVGLTEDAFRKAANVTQFWADVAESGVAAAHRDFQDLGRAVDVFTGATEYAAAAVKDVGEETRRAAGAGKELAEGFLPVVPVLKTVEGAAKDAARAVDDVGKADKGGVGSGFKGIKSDLGDTKSAFDDLAAAAQNYGDRAQNAGQKSSQSNAELAESARAAGKEVQKIGDTFAEIEHSTSGAANAMADALGAWRGEFAQTSDAAAEMFDSIVHGAVSSADAMKVFGTSDSGAGMLAGFAKITLAARAVNEELAQQRAAVARVAESLAGVGTSAEEGFGRFGATAQEAEYKLERMIAGVRAGKSEFDLLGQQDLAPLLSALDAARQRTAALARQAQQAREQLESMGESIQDQIDSIQGNQDAIEARRYQQQLEQLRDLAVETGNIGSDEYEQAVARAKRLHQIKMQQLQREAQEQARQTQPASSPHETRAGRSGGGMSSEVTVRIDGQHMGNVNPDDAASIESMARQMLPAIMRQLQQAARNSGRSSVVRLGGG